MNELVNEFKFISKSTVDGRTYSKVVVTVASSSLSEILTELEGFLKASGFCFTGSLDIRED